MKMTKLELFLILFCVDYPKELIIPDIDNIMKHPMDHGEFIWWLGCSFYMGFWVIISNRSSWWSSADLTMRLGVPIRLDNYMSSTRFQGILSWLLGRTHQRFSPSKPVPTKSQKIGFILLPSHPYETAKITEITESSFIIICAPRHQTHPLGHHNHRLPIDTSPKRRQ